LKDPARIEGLLCCHFVALVIQASVEGQIRTAMADADREAIPPNPKEPDCGPPTAPRVLEIFGGITRHHLRQTGKTVQIIDPELTDLQGQILELLGVPRSVYTPSPT
jgi:hypothetical protein